MEKQRGGSRFSGKRVRMYKDMGRLHCSFYLIFLEYFMKMELFGLTETETKLFHFHRIFKNGGGGGGGMVQANPLWIRRRGVVL